MPWPSPKVDKSVSIVSKTMQGLGTRLNVLEYAYEHDGGNDILVTDHNHICLKIKISRRVYFQQNWNVLFKVLRTF